MYGPLTPLTANTWLDQKPTRLRHFTPGISPTELRRRPSTVNFHQLGLPVVSTPEADWRQPRITEFQREAANSTCSVRDTKSRKGKRFSSISCDYQADADHNAALNVGDRSTHLFVKRQPAMLDGIRQRRLASQGVTMLA